MAESDLPKGAKAEQESPIPETIVRWDLTPQDIEKMDADELKQLVVEQQLMIGRLREAVEVLRLAGETKSTVTRADLEIIYSPEKHTEYEHLRDRELK